MLKANLILACCASLLAAQSKVFELQPGTKVPLQMINSISTKSAVVGEHVYLETVFPILTESRVVIPQGSNVLGTITQIQRPGKVKGRGEFHLRFDSLTLPNGTTRDFRAHLSNLDGSAHEELDDKEGTVRSPGTKTEDVRKVGEATATGAGLGGLAGIAGGSPGMGSAIGAGAAATVAVIGIMMSRGPDAVLAKGTTIEMVLDRQLQFTEDELDFSKAFPRRSKGDALTPTRLLNPSRGRPSQERPAQERPAQER
jgi:type IV secretion system protein VirB10